MKNLKLILAVIISVIILLVLGAILHIPSILMYELGTKDNLEILLSPVNPDVKALAADPDNRLVMKVEVRDISGKAVNAARIDMQVSKGLGEVQPSSLRTDRNGTFIVIYSPPEYDSNLFTKVNPTAVITARLGGSSKQSGISIELRRTPVVFVHGYQSTAYVFDNMKSYLSGKGFEGSGFTYKSEEGVKAGAKRLETYLQSQKSYYLSRGIQVGKFDLVTHSMGGLVARYYTSSISYGKYVNVRKIIFVSVPQQGSPWASFGAGIFKDQGVKDLIPENKLLADELPAMTNRGLNNTIQVGSLLGQYDEVVSAENASLDEWGIKTEMFAVGNSNFNMDSIFNGSIIEAANHKNMLNNSKVFDSIIGMLESKLPYPSKIRK